MAVLTEYLMIDISETMAKIVGGDTETEKIIDIVKLLTVQSTSTD
ncbi:MULTISPECIES: hypothetical protein [Prevotellaceae]|nr:MULTISPECIES: hypothetical protein [Prevotellaceae]